MSKKPRTRELLKMETSAGWRLWLKENHGRTEEVWLVFFKKHTDKEWITYDAAVEEALCFGWIDSIVRRIDDDTCARKFTPRRATSQWSEPNKKRAAKLIRQRRMTKAGRAVIEEAKANGKWDESVGISAAMPMPIELQQALERNREATVNLMQMAPSYRRQFLGWVGAAKREETRRRRAQEAVQLLAQNKKLGLK